MDRKSSFQLCNHYPSHPHSLDSIYPIRHQNSRVAWSGQLISLDGQQQASSWAISFVWGWYVCKIIYFSNLLCWTFRKKNWPVPKSSVPCEHFATRIPVKGNYPEFLQNQEGIHEPFWCSLFTQLQGPASLSIQSRQDNWKSKQISTALLWICLSQIL